VAGKKDRRRIRSRRVRQHLVVYKPMTVLTYLCLRIFSFN
jgi:hypothetical protein